MATTRLIPMHASGGKTIAQSISDRTDYALNPEKTDEGRLISAYACDPEAVDVEFLIAKQMYKANTGRESRKARDVIAYQIRQSFLPGEVTPEQANEIGYELAMRFTKGEHQFIVATHVDKAHVHSHIIFNSTTLDCDRKFNNYKDSADVVREISDQLCLEHNLSIIENPAPSAKHYIEWLTDKGGTTWKEKLRRTIDNLLPSCSSFEGFLQKMQAEGYACKTGKHLAFRAPGQERFTRGKTLGDAYTEAGLRARIARKEPVRKAPVPQKKAKGISLVIDIQEKLAQGKGAGYAHWAKVFNLKEMAKSLNFLTEHGIETMEEMLNRAQTASLAFRMATDKLKDTEANIRDVKELKTHITNYGRTREVYRQYRQSKNRDDFFEAHRADLTLHLQAKKAFDALPGKTLPSLKVLNDELDRLSAKQKAEYENYRKAKAEMLEWAAVKHNIDRTLSTSGVSISQGKER